MKRRPIRASVVLVAASTCLVLALAQPASAAVDVTTSAGGVVDISSDAAADNITVTCVGGFLVPAPPSPVACGDVTGISAGLGAGTDILDLSAVGPGTFPHLTQTLVDLNSNDTVADSIKGSQFRDDVEGQSEDQVIAGAGDDLVVGAGNVSGGDGDDVIQDANSAQGGSGDDRFINLPNIGPYDGGAGYDRIQIDLSTQNLGGLASVGFVYTDTSATLNALAPGVPPLSSTAATTGFEEMDLSFPSGYGGFHQEVDGSAFSGRSVLSTGNGNDAVRTGLGNDDVQTGAGNDTIDPGAGADLVHAGSGDDTVAARDGSQDVIDCGDGADTVTADAIDTLTNCEKVLLPAPETGKVAGPKKVAQGAKATFTFSSPAAGATFQCAVDKGAFKACKSPFKLSTKKLKVGKHTLLVRAVASASNVDATPSAHKFKVTAKKKR
jgi:Ca2+-binding RTX toxin-like protein